MIVFIDTKTQNILLYGEKGLITIPFSDAGDIYEHIGNKKVKYITNVMTVGADDIVGLIGRLGFKFSAPAVESTNKYLHSTNDGTIYINEELKFEGKFDCKLIDKELKEILKQNPLAKKLLSSGRIEIIGEVQKRKLDKEYKKVLAKKVEDQESKDNRLNSIIMDGRVEDWDGNINLSDFNNAIEIDLESGGRIDAGGGASVNTMSELIDKMEGK
jgi:hypothetical protein